MAFSNSPYYSTYSTFDIPVVYNIEVDTNFNMKAGMVNLIPLKYKDSAGKETLHAMTRPPINGYGLRNVAGDIFRGMYVWEKTPGTVYYFAITNTFVWSSTDGITWTHVDTLLTNVTTPVRFTEFIDDVNTKKLIMVDGVEGYVYTSNAAGTKIVSANFPTPHVAFPVVIDAYLFLAKTGTGDIYNSDLNHPETWTAGSFISSELYPDDVQALVKVNNYLLAIGTQGCEYFYDAANATASPLQRQDGASLPFGTSFPNSIASDKNTVVMIANPGDGEPILRFIEDFKYKDIPNSEFVLYNLKSQITQSYTSYPNVRGYFLRINGSLIYGFTGSGVSTFSGYNGFYYSFFYSFDTDIWFTMQGTSSSRPFPVFFTSPATTGSIATYVGGMFQLPADGNYYTFIGKMEYSANATPTDTMNGNGGVGTTLIPYSTTINTSQFDCGTPNWKSMSRAVVDVESSNYSATNSFNLSAYDFNYSSPAYSQSITGLINARNPLVEFRQLGMFKKRSFILADNGATFIRVRNITCTINKGQS